jgi:hypothetical protein
MNWLILPPAARAERARPRQTRAVAGECFLEACVENAAKAPLVLDYVRFDPTPGLLAAPVLRGGGARGAPGAGLAEYVQALQARPPGAGRCLHARMRRLLVTCSPSLPCKSESQKK